MNVKLTRFDAATYLATEADMAAYINEIAQDIDPALMASALADVARARAIIIVAMPPDHATQRHPCHIAPQH